MRQRHATFMATLDVIEGPTCQQPVLLLLEDAQWADATSVELIGMLCERLRVLPILAIITFRPEFKPPWPRLANVTTLVLDRLDQQSVALVIRQVAAGRTLPKDVLQTLVARADGNPLFAEELTKAALESESPAEHPEGHRANGLLPPLVVPATLDAALAQLEGAGLVFRSGAAPDATYSFKHALIQDAAYEGLLRRKRKMLHRRIAEALCDRFPARADAEPEMVAQHFTRAGLSGLAVEWWSKAGDMALRRVACHEPVSHLSKAVELMDELSEESGQNLLRLRLHIAYGKAVMLTQSFDAPEVSASFARAHELARGVEGAFERYIACYGL